MDPSEAVYIVAADDELPLILHLSHHEGSLQPLSLLPSSGGSQVVTVCDEVGNDMSDSVVVEMFECIVDDSGDVRWLMNSTDATPLLSCTKSTLTLDCGDVVMEDDAVNESKGHGTLVSSHVRHDVVQTNCDPFDDTDSSFSITDPIHPSASLREVTHNDHSMDAGQTISADSLVPKEADPNSVVSALESHLENCEPSSDHIQSGNCSFPQSPESLSCQHAVDVNKVDLVVKHGYMVDDLCLPNMVNDRATAVTCSADIQLTCTSVMTTGTNCNNSIKVTSQERLQPRTSLPANCSSAASKLCSSCDVDSVCGQLTDCSDLSHRSTACRLTDTVCAVTPAPCIMPSVADCSSVGDDKISVSQHSVSNAASTSDSTEKPSDDRNVNVLRAPANDVVVTKHRSLRAVSDFVADTMRVCSDIVSVYTDRIEKYISEAVVTMDCECDLNYGQIDCLSNAASYDKFSADGATNQTSNVMTTKDTADIIVFDDASDILDTVSNAVGQGCALLELADSDTCDLNSKLKCISTVADAEFHYANQTINGCHRNLFKSAKSSSNSICALRQKLCALHKVKTILTKFCRSKPPVCARNADSFLESVDTDTFCDINCNKWLRLEAIDRELNDRTACLEHKEDLLDMWLERVKQTEQDLHEKQLTLAEYHRLLPVHETDVLTTAHQLEPTCEQFSLDKQVSSSCWRTSTKNRSNYLTKRKVLS